MRQSGAYGFSADVKQTRNPIAGITAVGSTSKTDRFFVKGNTDLPNHRMDLRLWNNGGAINIPDTASAAAAYEIQIEHNSARARIGN